MVTVNDDAIVFTATDEPTEVDVWRWAAQGGLSRLSSGAGVDTAAGGHGLTCSGRGGLEHFGTTWRCNDHEFSSKAEQPLIEPKVKLLTVGERGLAVGLLMPSDHEPGRRLPVLLDPYGGPQYQRVQASRHQWLESQWLADQGFAVVVADGRGTPGRGRGWARGIRGDLAAAPLQDQVDALLAVAAEHPDLDLNRVGIRGWSFGGYLSALALLRRPDVFHAAVAGAPVSDWRLYDTHYSERFLGSDPDGADRDAYDRSALLADAPSLRRPLLLIHGLADDNVLAAHTLQLSQRLTESGVSHAVCR